MTAPKYSVVVDSFEPRISNTLRGFCTVVIPELHLRIVDCTVHEKNESRWIGLPAKAQIGRDGLVRKDERGKMLYVPAIEFTDKLTREAFSRRVIDALIMRYPGAFVRGAA